MSARQQRGVEAMDAIRNVLFDDWDPIGVKAFAPRDEYDHYIAGVYRLLSRGASEDEIIEHLCGLESDQVGTEPRKREALRPVARKLLALKVAVGKE